MIHQLKRHLITLRFEYPTYAYDVNSDVNGKKICAPNCSIRQTRNNSIVYDIPNNPIRQFCTKHVPMTQYAIIISTSTTPSCGGPLRAQIFRKVCFYEQKQDFWPIIRKVCFYEQKQDFWPIRTRFDPLKGPPNSYFFNIFFQT